MERKEEKKERFLTLKGLEYDQGKEDTGIELLSTRIVRAIKRVVNLGEKML